MEVDGGCENLWKRERFNWRKNSANFGRYMSKNYFKAFLSAVPYCFDEKKLCFIDKKDERWEIYLPCIEQYNLKRQLLIKMFLLVFNKSMSGCCSKTSKLGGLPSYTLAPRKRVPFGAMYKKRAECTSDIIIFRDVGIINFQDVGMKQEQ